MGTFENIMKKGGSNISSILDKSLLREQNHFKIQHCLLVYINRQKGSLGGSKRQQKHDFSIFSAFIHTLDLNARSINPSAKGLVPRQLSKRLVHANSH